jgi:hypothetical protein
MAKNKVSEWDTTASNNTDIAGINIAEGCAPSGINNAIREIMAQVKDMQTGSDSDGLVVGGAFTSSGGAVFSSGTTFSGSVVMSSTVTMSGTNNIGNTTSSTILSGSVTQTSGSVLYLDAAATTASAPPITWAGDTNTGIYRPAADTLALVTNGSDRIKIGSTGVINIGGNVVLGTGDATTSVAGSILRGPSSAGTNIAGGDIEIQAGNGTGTGGSGNIVLKTADVGSSGSTANTLTQRLLITPKGGFSFGGGATSYGTAGQVLKSNGDAPPSFGAVGPTSGTVQATTGGTSIDFTGIPAGTKRIIVMFSAVSTTGTSQLIVQLGDSGGFEITGYAGAIQTNGAGTTAFSSGFNVFDYGVNTQGANGQLILSLLNSSTNLWVGSAICADSSAARIVYGSGTKTLSDTITSLRITTVSGTPTFDAGSINILYE